MTLEEAQALKPGALLRKWKNFYLVDQRREGSIILIPERRPGLSREFNIVGRWNIAGRWTAQFEEGDSDLWKDFHRVA